MIQLQNVQCHVTAELLKHTSSLLYRVQAVMFGTVCSCCAVFNGSCSCKNNLRAEATQNNHLLCSALLASSTAVVETLQVVMMQTRSMHCTSTMAACVEGQKLADRQSDQALQCKPTSLVSTVSPVS